MRFGRGVGERGSGITPRRSDLLSATGLPVRNDTASRPRECAYRRGDPADLLWVPSSLFFPYRFAVDIGRRASSLVVGGEGMGTNINPLIVLIFVLVVFAIMMFLALNTPG